MRLFARIAAIGGARDTETAVYRLLVWEGETMKPYRGNRYKQYRRREAWEIFWEFVGVIALCCFIAGVFILGPVIFGAR